MSSTDITAPPRSDKPRKGGTIRFLLLLALAAWAFRGLVVAPFNIPSGSMLPTLYIGDYLLVAKWPYGYSRFSFPLGFPPISGRLLAHLPRRGDVVVFRPPGNDSDCLVAQGYFAQTLATLTVCLSATACTTAAARP